MLIVILEDESWERNGETRCPSFKQRSMDSALSSTKRSVSRIMGSVDAATTRRWVSAAEEAATVPSSSGGVGGSTGAAAARQNSTTGGSGGSSRLSPAAETATTDIIGMPSTARGPNVSILHLRSTSEPWEASPATTYPTPSSKSYFVNRSAGTGAPPLTKHHSLGNPSGHHKWTTSQSFHSGGEVNSPEMFIGASNCNRELSPVRWCDREVDGVYLGRSGWVQVQQRSLDESRRTSYKKSSATPASQPVKRTVVKLSDYHFNSEPVKTSSERPGYLSLQKFEHQSISPPPSPARPEPESPPSVTPIISPPPAFQDKKTKNHPMKSRTFFGKTPFLPRSNAIEDSDASPPMTPPPSKWTLNASTTPQIRKPKVTVISPSVDKPLRSFNRMPQTKSLEDTTAIRRSQFLQHYRGSSSSSSSSMGFRSLDSSFNRPGSIMPRLSENTDSSVDHYQDADEEDNNSSSINISMLPLNPQIDRNREKVSPSGRTRSIHHRNQNRRSPAGSDTNKPLNCTSPSSSSSSSNEFLSRSPPGPAQQQIRRPPAVNRAFQSVKSPLQEDPSVQRVRRSRSLQLPEKKPPPHGRDPSVQTRVSPQHPESHRMFVKMGSTPERPKKYGGVHKSKPQMSLEGDVVDDDMLREAEVVTGFLYGNRSRAAAQALLMHRYNNAASTLNKEERNRDVVNPVNNGITVYYIGNSKKDKRTLIRGATSPSFPSSGSNTKHNLEMKDRDVCSRETCDFWPRCAHREPNFIMRSSQSYPMHARSLDTDTTSRTVPMERKPPQEHYKLRVTQEMDRKKQATMTAKEKRPSPNRSSLKFDHQSEGSSSKKSSPVNPKCRTPTPGTVSGSSSGSDVWLTASGKSNVKSSGASTPLEEMLISVKDEKGRDSSGYTRPGSAPSEDRSSETLISQQRSMSLPKSFLSASYQPGGTIPWQRHGTESLGSSPGLPRKIPTPEISHTAPVTPQHEGNRHRSPPHNAPARRAKATSTPQLLEGPATETSKWGKQFEHSGDFSLDPAGVKGLASRRNLSDGNVRGEKEGATAQSVLQKFRKTFSLRFQGKKDSKESCVSDGTKHLSEAFCDQSEEELSPRHELPAGASCDIDDEKDPIRQASEHKYKFGPLIWRSSKERKKLNKAARSAKCNSGDSGIQIEMVPGCGGAGDSTESHDTDPLGDELDSPPAVRRRKLLRGRPNTRPHSELLNQILIDKFKADLKQRTQNKHTSVRRTRSDLGGQRLFHWDRSSSRRMASSRDGVRPPSPRKRPPDAPAPVGVVLRPTVVRRAGILRRSLSQPIDIDKLSPLMRAKAAGLRLGGSHIFSDEDHDNRLGTSDDDMMSDSESSTASLSERKKSLELAMDEEMIILAEAVFDHVAIEAEELAFRAGDVIEVLETANRDWWWGSTNGKSGWFPAQFVRLRVSQEDTVEDCLAAMASGQHISKQIRRRTSISLLSNDQVRTSVVRELVNTERDFVKVLQDVVEGYIAECRKRTDMFTEEQIETIFINIEDILEFQSVFLKDLEALIDWDAPYKSCVGSCFLKRRSGFKIYSDYCNSHPVATTTLQELYQINNYNKFFEACRLMRGLIEIPLDGYLLTPVQRICKYPLQLAELLKYTKVDHPDYDDIKEALETMKEVAMLINERKRRMESLEKLAAWQQRVEGWEGEDLIEISSQLIHQGEVVRVTTGMWTNSITLFLFDHQIVYCKKDILKRNTYVYKGRICLDTCEIIDVPDGKDTHLGVSVRYAIKLYSIVRDKWLLFCCRSSNDKQKWLRAFSEERKIVVQDKNNGLDFPTSSRQLARVAARCQKRPPRKPRGSKNFKHDSGYMGSSLQLNSNTNSLGRKVGTWFNFGTNKKSRNQQRDVS